MPLGMITPDWSPSLKASTGWTTFKLSKITDIRGVARQLKDVHPTCLLFLRQLRRLRINIKKPSRDTTLQIDRYHDDGNIIRLVKSVDGNDVTQRFLVVTYSVWPMVPDQNGRANGLTSEIVLAFPIDSENYPRISTWRVHSFTPLKDSDAYGFKVSGNSFHSWRL